MTNTKVAVDATDLATGIRLRVFNRLPDLYGSISSAVWSRDGSQVLITVGYRGRFVRDADREYHFESPFGVITRMDSGGTKAENLITATASRSSAVADIDYFHGAIWAPDEQRIAVHYTIPRDGVNPRGGDKCPIIVNRDGTGMKKLEKCEAGDIPRYWSVDGKWVAVWSQAGGAGKRLWAYAVDGTERVLLETLVRDKVKFYDQRYSPWRIVDQPTCDENNFDFWSCG